MCRLRENENNAPPPPPKLHLAMEVLFVMPVDPSPGMGEQLFPVFSQKEASKQAVTAENWKVAVSGKVSEGDGDTTYAKATPSPFTCLFFVWCFLSSREFSNGFFNVWDTTRCIFRF